MSVMLWKEFYINPNNSTLNNGETKSISTNKIYQL